MLSRLLSILLISLICINTAAASELTLLVWERTVEAVKNEIMIPLKKEFEEAEIPQGEEPWQIYIGNFTEALRELKSDLDADAYQVMRDLLFTASENLAISKSLSECKKPATWRQAQGYIYTGLDLVGNVVGKLDR